MNLTELRTVLERKQGTKQSIQADITKATEDIAKWTQQIGYSIQAQDIIQIVAEQTQSQLEYQISELVSLGMEYVFEDPYSIALKFKPARGKVDCVLNFARNGKQFDPLGQSGYGTVDIADFGFRIAFIGLSDPSPRMVLILDEPFKHIKGIEDNVRAIQMVKRISRDLGIQIIMVSDERAPIRDIKDGADKIFYVTIENGVSQLTEEVIAA